MSKGLAAAAAQCDGTLDKSLKKFLKAEVVDKGLKVRLLIFISLNFPSLYRVTWL